MSGYNTKNYTEQGGDVTHIGGTLEFGEDAEVKNFPGGGSCYTLPPATASTLGGIKVGSGLSVTNDGTLSADGITPAENQADSEATTITALKDDFNGLLSKLIAAGFMADAEETES